MRRTHKCACGCGTVVPLLRKDGKPLYLARGHGTGLGLTSNVVIQVYDEVRNMAQTAKRLGCSPATVRNWLNRVGHKHWSPVVIRIKPNKWNLDIDAVLEAYRRERSLRRTAVEFGCSRTVIRRILRQQGAPCNGKWRMSEEGRQRIKDSLKRLRATGWGKKHRHPNWNSKEVPCTICSKQVLRSLSHAQGRIVCSKECLSELRRRDRLGPDWRSGPRRKTGFYNLAGWKRVRQQILERDGFRCQLCHHTEEQSGFSLEVHHIDRSTKNASPSNLITLCKSCHHGSRVNSERSDRGLRALVATDMGWLMSMTA